MSDPIRILIADDHPIVRQGLEVVLASQPDLKLVGQATNGEEAVQLAQAVQPDVILMDLQMPVKDGLTAIQEIVERDPTARILVLTSFPDDTQLVESIRVGASGVLLKDSPPEQLLDAVRTVHRGESVLHPTIARKLIQEVRQPTTRQSTIDTLTPRETEVLKCLALGMSNQEVANQLSISIRTVTTHVRNLLDKLDLENRTQAALYAVEHGLGAAPESSKYK